MRNDVVEVKCWRYVEAVHSTAHALTNKVMSLVDEENNPAFTSYFKTEMVALGTDGASNMIGRHNSLANGLDAYVRGERARNGRPLVKFHCGNHKLALAYNDVMYSKDPNLQYIKDITSNLNKLASFYSTKAYRRRHDLREKAKEEALSIRRYKGIQKVRWMSATQESYRAFDGNFRVMFNHLSSVRDAEYNDVAADTRMQARDLLAFFTDRHVLSTIYHHLDIITTLSIWSKHMEHKVASIMDMRDNQEKVELELQALLAVPGVYLSKFYKDSTCDGIECNERSFPTAKKVMFRGAELIASVQGFPPLTQTRQLVINFLLDALERRFPKAAVSAFSVINPESLPSVTAQDANALGNYLVQTYGFDPSISNKLLGFLSQLATSEFYQATYQKQHPVKFWELALASYPALKQDKDLEKAIHIGLVQPASTARYDILYGSNMVIKGWLKINMYEF